MTESFHDWPELSQRRLAGETLSPAEHARLEYARHYDPRCAAEMRLLDELATFVDRPVAGPSPAARAIARAALVRVEAGHASAPPAPPATPVGRARWWVASGVVLAVAASMLLVFSWLGSWLGRSPAVDQEPFVAQLTLAAGDVYIAGHPANGADPTIPPDATVTVQQGVACIELPTRVDVCLDDHSSVTVGSRTHADTGKHATIEVLHGHAVARLDPQPEGHTFSLSSGEIQATAVGTVFSLDVSEDHRTVTVAILQGAVEVAGADEAIRLSAHEVAQIEEGRLERTPLASDDQARDLEILAALAPVPRGPRGQVAILVSPPGSEVLIDGRPRGRSPLVATLSAGTHRLEIADSEQGGVRVSETIQVVPGTRLERRIDLGTPEAPSPAAQDPASPELSEPPEPPSSGSSRARGTSVASAEQMLADAHEHRRASQWRAAARDYRRLIKAHPRSASAHNALVSLGDLLLDRLHDPAAAARSYARYLRNGGGTLAREARYGQVRAKRAVSDRRGERKAIEAYLRHHPKTSRATALRERLTKLGG
ncbi:MAG: FecR domain-containing protein [Myxococcota bacterium]